MLGYIWGDSLDEDMVDGAVSRRISQVPRTAVRIA